MIPIFFDHTLSELWEKIGAVQVWATMVVRTMGLWCAPLAVVRWCWGFINYAPCAVIDDGYTHRQQDRNWQITAKKSRPTLPVVGAYCSLRWCHRHRWAVQRLAAPPVPASSVGGRHRSILMLRDAHQDWYSGSDYRDCLYGTGSCRYICRTLQLSVCWIIEMQLSTQVWFTCVFWHGSVGWCWLGVLVFSSTFMSEMILWMSRVWGCIYVSELVDTYLVCDQMCVFM